MSSIPIAERPSVRTSIAALLLAAVVATAAAAVSLVASKELFHGLVAASLFIAFGAVCLHPARATSICLFLMYINAPAVAVRFHGLSPVVAVATVGMLLIPIVYYVIWKREPVYVDAVVPWLLVFTGVQFASALLATDKVVATESLLAFLLEGLVVFLLVSNAVRTIGVTWALIAAGVFMGALGVYQRVTGMYWNDFKGFAQVTDPDWNSLGEISGGRWPAGPIGDKNYYAQFMLMLLPFALFNFWYEDTRARRIAGLLAGMVIFAGIGLSGSRGAAIGLVAMLLVMLVLGYTKVRHLAGFALVVFSLLLVMPQYRERVLSIADVVNVLRGSDVRQADLSVQGRLTEMYAATLVFLEHPLLGVGPGNFPAHFLEKADRLGFTVHGVERRAHCLYLEIAAETGIPGLFCMAIILGITVRNLFRAHAAAPTLHLRGMSAAALLALFAMMVTGLFLSLAYIRYFWLILGLCAAIARIACQEGERHAMSLATPIEQHV